MLIVTPTVLEYCSVVPPSLDTGRPACSTVTAVWGTVCVESQAGRQTIRHKWEGIVGSCCSVPMVGTAVGRTDGALLGSDATQDKSRQERRKR